MTEHRLGTLYWIDHYVAPTNDLYRHIDFMEQVLGATVHQRMPLTTAARQRGIPIGVFSKVGRYHSVGSFLQDKMLPASGPLGSTPRYGYFIRDEDISAHLRRLDEHGAVHSEPIATCEAGEEGTAIYFQDPDENQYEFWAPTHMPAGAVESDNPKHVGRISHVVLEAPSTPALCGAVIIAQHAKSRARILSRQRRRLDARARRNRPRPARTHPGPRHRPSRRSDPDPAL